MLKIYKRTIHINYPENPQPRFEYQLDKKTGASLSNILAIPAIIAGAIVETLMFSVFFAVLLIPLGIIGFRAWRMTKAAQQASVRQTEGDSIAAKYTVISDKDKQ